METFNQAITFFHSHGITNVYATQHLQLTVLSLMIGFLSSFGANTLKMECKGMFPQGFHAIRQKHLPNNSREAPFRPHSVCPVLYSFNHLRDAVKNRDADDPHGPKRDLEVISYFIQNFIHTVRHLPYSVIAVVFANMNFLPHHALAIS